MNSTTTNSTNIRPNGPAALEDRLHGFGKVGLLKMAGALVTENRGVALVVGTALAALPVDQDATDDLVAAGLDSLASLATAEAAALRGEPALR
ncbi:MAG: hypothetical protein WKF86_09595 [Acidimicrobiales bacterium]